MDHFMSQRPRQSASVMSYVVIGLIIALLAAIAVPNFVKARFDFTGEPLTLRVIVQDEGTGQDIPGAAVRIPNMTTQDVVTDAGGRCEAVAHFRATGRMGDGGEPDAGVMHVIGTMRVQAPGYETWEKPFPELFGKRYNYVTGGSTVTQVVKLARHADSGPR